MEKRGLYSQNENQAYLQHPDVRESIRTVTAAVLHNVLQPLDVRLSITVYFADELSILSDLHSDVGRKACLKNGPVRRAF